MNNKPQTAAQVDLTPDFVEDTSVPVLSDTNVAAKLALSVAALKRPFGALNQTMERLELPPKETALKAPLGSMTFNTGTPTWTFKTDEGELSLVLILQPGTWEPPRGNSMPRVEPPIVQAVQVSGPNRLSFDVPDDAERVVADGGGELHHLQIWDGFTYFEQGNKEHGWTVTRSMVRADFHRFAAEEKALEDAILALVGPLANGVDMQKELAKKFANKRVGDSHIYDFGAGKLDVTHATNLRVTWNAPTKIPAIFDRFEVEYLSTSFAHNAGQMSVPIELENLTIYPSNYFIKDPDSQEAEMGLAKDASFRGMSFKHQPGQVRSAPNHLMPSGK